MDSYTMAATMTKDGMLPQEIVTDILSRLPVKSLCRFKCVSPSWNSLISDPHFAKTHLNRTKTQTPKHLGQQTSLIHSSHNLYSVNFTDVNPTATKLDFPIVEQHTTPDNQVIVRSSCNGLLLVSHQDSFREGVELFLWNPASREYKKLPTIPSALNPVHWVTVTGSVCGVGYNPFTDDYKVVMLTSYYTEPSSSSDENTIVVVYSLKNNAWRRIQDFHYVLAGSPCGVFLNGCIHFDCWSPLSPKYVAFDLSEEVFSEVPLPAACSDDSENGKYYTLEVLGDCLCLVFFSYRHGQVEAWMIEEYGIRESWTKLTIDMPGMSTVELLCLLGQNEYLLKAIGVIQGRVYGEKLIVYDPKKETMRDMVISGIPTKFNFGVTYVESLISPYHGGGIGRQ